MFIVFFIAFCATLAAGKTGPCIFFAVLTVWSVCRGIIKDRGKHVDPPPAPRDYENFGGGDVGSCWRTVSHDGIIERSDEMVRIEADGSIIVADSDADTDDCATFDCD